MNRGYQTASKKYRELNPDGPKNGSRLSQPVEWDRNSTRDPG